jgi:dolichol-phosphate mannosyltransferase
MSKIVIIPTYNEKENIEPMIRKVFSLEGDFHILIVDDGSPDGTASIVKDLQKEFGHQLHLVERTGKLGLGTAYITGFKYCMDHGYEYIFEMDCDFSHNPDDLIRLHQAVASGAGSMSVGSRYIKGGKVKNWPLNRILLSYFASVYVRFVTWMPIADTTAGFVCYHRSIFEKMNLEQIQFIGYAFQIEMKFATWKLGFKIKEVPITFTDRVYGESKMSGSIFKEAIFGVLKMALQGFTKSYSK